MIPLVRKTTLTLNVPVRRDRPRPCLATLGLSWSATWRHWRIGVRWKLP